MNSYLQKGPDGLLGALDLKTTGQNPSVFPEELQGVIDCLAFYLLRNRRLSSQTAAFAAINTTISAFTVAQDEVVRVKGVGIVMSRPAADVALVIDMSISLRRATGTGTIAVFQTSLPAVAATDLIQQRGIVFDKGLWLGPGDRLALTVSTTMTAAGSNVTLGVDYDTMQSG